MMFTFKDGPQVEVSRVGDKEIELTLHSERHRGVMQDDGTVQWDDGDIWRREDFSPTVPSQIGIDMLAGQCGTVVGFASDTLEVKFPSKIIQCPASWLQVCTKSQTSLAQQVGCATHLPPSSSQEVKTRRKEP